MEQLAEQPRSDLRELVAFRVAEQDFCVDIMIVREIRGWAPATILPHAPDYVLGVINLRGAVVPIVNLAIRLKLQPSEPDMRHVVIIAVVGGQVVGILVDAVSDILSVAPDAIQETPKVSSDMTKSFIEGVIAVDERMLRLLDLNAIFPAGSKGRS